MAVLTIQSLIDQREAIQGKKALTYEIETSLGTIICKAPSATVLSESSSMDRDNDGDCYLIYSCIIEPNLSDSKLQKEFGCIEPLDIVNKIFSLGEVRGIANALVELAGYNKSKLATKIHEQISK